MLDLIVCSMYQNIKSHIYSRSGPTVFKRPKLSNDITEIVILTLAYVVVPASAFHSHLLEVPNKNACMLIVFEKFTQVHFFLHLMTTMPS